LRLAALKYGKKQPELFLAEIQLLPQAPTAVSEQLKSVFAERNLPVDKVSLVIPRHLAIVRFLNLPSTDEREVASMVQIESLKQIPYRIQDAVIGQRIIEKQVDGYSTVLAAATELGQVKPYLDILNQAGISPEKITLSSEAIFMWYLSLPDKLKATSADTVALINIDCDYIDVVILEKEKIKFNRGFIYSSHVPDKLYEAAEEIIKSVSTYQRQAGRHLNKMIVTGAQSLVEPISKLLKPAFEINLQLIRQDEVLTPIQEPKPDFSQASFAGILGLVLKNQEAMINLLPREIANGRRQKAFKKELTKFFSLLFCAITALSLVAAKQVWNRYSYIRMLNSKLELIAPEVTKAKAMRENIKVIRREIEQRPLAIEVFSEVYKAAPPQVKLNLLDYKSGEFLLLKGTAGSLEEIISFVSSLNESPYFENVRIKYTTQRKTQAQATVDFEVAADLTREP